MLIEDIVKKLDRLLGDETTTGDVELPQGEVIGMTYRKKKKKNKLGTETVVHESTIYASGTQAVPTIVGSRQTRIVGRRDGEIEVLTRKPRPLHFNRLLGAYLPDGYENEEGDDE